MNGSTSEWQIVKVSRQAVTTADDQLAVEEPLAVSITHGPPAAREQHELYVTMRTPGHDRELIIGFLKAEGIISDPQVVQNFDFSNGANQTSAIVEVEPGVELALNPKRNFLANSSCGVCGKSSISDILPAGPSVADDFRIKASQLYDLPSQLLLRQSAFDSTGGLHAVGMFAEDKLRFMFEDVGRHNAMDKVIGAAAMQGMLPLHRHICLLSGRASFELIQKASSAGVSIVASVGAPSSLAVSTAFESGITLVGFLSRQRFNVYTHAYRITFEE